MPDLLESCKVIAPLLDGLEDEGRDNEHRRQIKEAVENFKAALAEAEAGRGGRISRELPA